MYADETAKPQRNVEPIEKLTTVRFGRQRTNTHHIANDFLFPSFQIRIITYSSSFWRPTGRQKPIQDFFSEKIAICRSEWNWVCSQYWFIWFRLYDCCPLNYRSMEISYSSWSFRFQDREWHDRLTKDMPNGCMPQSRQSSPEMSPTECWGADVRETATDCNMFDCFFLWPKSRPKYEMIYNSAYPPYSGQWVVWSPQRKPCAIHGSGHHSKASATDRTNPYLRVDAWGPWNETLADSPLLTALTQNSFHRVAFWFVPSKFRWSIFWIVAHHTSLLALSWFRQFRTGNSEGNMHLCRTELQVSPQSGSSLYRSLKSNLMITLWSYSIGIWTFTSFNISSPDNSFSKVSGKGEPWFSNRFWSSISGADQAG
jgi:hypothetical protein